MLPSLLLTFREGLEAALIIGIMLGTLTQIGHRDRRAWIWSAVGLSAALSLALAVALSIAGARLQGTAEYVFEGVAMLLAVVVLTWMIFWMRGNARALAQTLRADIRSAVQRRHNWALFSIAFLAVFREGVETALFLTATRLAGDGWSTLAGALIGLALAVAVGWGIYAGGLRLNLRRFFDLTSVTLLIFAAGLFAHGIHEFQEAGWLPLLTAEAWNTRALLDDHSTGGAVLRTLIGYNDNPTVLEVVAYWSYWAVVLGALAWWATRRGTGRQPLPSGA